MSLARPWLVPLFALLFAFSAWPAGPPGLQQPDAKAVFTKLCAACHGPAGAGDGPAAAALKPRPASFTDAQFQASRTDAQLTASITGGKPPMPPFGKQLTAEQIRALVAYVRALGKQAKAR